MVFLFGFIPKIIDFLQVGNNVFIGELIMFIYLLLYASLFGIADKAEKKLEKVCPEIITYNRREDFELLKK